jgi:para-nitrobenzyl esterase
MIGQSVSEACLFLNVWTPARVPASGAAKLLPVLVYIHGGSFMDMSGATPILNSTTFTSRDLVFVSLNYRLGILGFWRHPELTKAHPDAPTNFGLLDQQEALAWVQDNIQAFGGDPSRVTLMGSHGMP